MTKAEMIADLIIDKFSGFKDGDESVLEACSDVRLEEFRAASAQRQIDASNHSKLEGEQRNTAARLKVAEDRMKAAADIPSEDEWLSKAPPKFKTLIEGAQAAEEAERTSIVTQLADRGHHTAEELKAKSIDELRTLAAYASVVVPDFSGKGVVRAAGSSGQSYAPPNPYDAALKAMSSKAVN